MCRIFDEGDATITSFTITPESSPQGKVYDRLGVLLHDFLVTVKAAPHVCVIRTGQP